jgi:hypothetical protein
VVRTVGAHASCFALLCFALQLGGACWLASSPVQHAKLLYHLFNHFSGHVFAFFSQPAVGAWQADAFLHPDRQGGRRWGGALSSGRRRRGSPGVAARERGGPVGGGRPGGGCCRRRPPVVAARGKEEGGFPGGGRWRGPLGVAAWGFRRWGPPGRADGGGQSALFL